MPVSADIEAGYGPTPDDVADTTEAVTEAGAVGVNLEDRPGPDEHILWPIELQCERLAAARDAADRLEIPFVLNARTDVFLAGVGEPAERESLVLERAASPTASSDPATRLLALWGRRSTLGAIQWAGDSPECRQLAALLWRG